MGRSVVFNGLELIKPDAYSALDVSRLLTPTAGGVGIVALVGESKGGKPGLHIFPGGASPAVVKKELISGPGADMVRMALRSGVDPLVQGGASTVLFFKTNNSTPSSLNVGSPTKFTITTKQYGAQTALYTASISNSGGQRFLTVRDEQGIPETSVGVGSKQYFTINRSTAGSATAAQARLLYVTGVLRLQGQHDVGAGLVTAFDLDVTGKTLKQIKTLVESTYAGWTITIPAVADESFLLSNLDIVSSYQGCYDTTTYGFLASIYELVQWATNISALVDIVRAAGNDGDAVPSSLALTSLAGGTDGSTSNSAVQTALNELLKTRVNILVPLFSSDNQDGSTVTIASVNAAVKDHVQSRSSILGRSECQAYVSIKGNKSAFKAMAATMGSRYVSVTSQKVTDLDIDGVLKTFDEYAFAVVCAQTQAGSPIGTPLTYRLLPVTGLSQDTSWTPAVDGNELILAGCLIGGPDENNPLRVIAGYTSWLSDTNNANIYIETVESLAIFSFNHRLFMKQRFLGQSSFTRQDVLDAIEESLKFEKSSSSASIKDYDFSQTKIISVTAGRLEYELSVVPWEGTNFILPTVVAIRETTTA